MVIQFEEIGSEYFLNGKLPPAGFYFKIPLANKMYAYGRYIAAHLFSFYNPNLESVDKNKIDEVFEIADPMFSIYIHKCVFFAK
jgi:hypothetical protein